MSEKDKITKEKLFYKGIVNLSEAYEYAYSFLREGEEYGITEEYYSEKISGESKDVEIKWVATKKVTDYFKINLDIKWKVLGMKNIEVEIDGKKKEMNKVSELSIDIKGVLEKDYNSKWESNPTHKFFKEMYHKYVIPQRTEKKENDVIEMVQKFKDEMKAFLDLTGRGLK